MFALFEDEALPSSWPQYGNIEFRNVSLKYPAQTENLIADFNLMIPAGQRVSTTLHFFVCFKWMSFYLHEVYCRHPGWMNFKWRAWRLRFRICFWTSWCTLLRTNSIVNNKQSFELERYFDIEEKAFHTFGVLVSDYFILCNETNLDKEFHSF